MKPAPRSIVLLDDEKSYTELMTQLLTDNLDCAVHPFTRPLDALQALPAVDPAVVVTDYHMPQLDGLEFIRQAAPLAPRATFVIITGHSLTTDDERVASLGALKSILAKPFGWRRLADEIIRVWPPATTAPTLRVDPAPR